MRRLKRHRSLACWTAAAAIVADLPGFAHARAVFVPSKLGDVKYADVVVIGRIDNYRIIRDEAFRKRMLASPSFFCGHAQNV